MEGVKYEAPETLQAAVGLLAAATGTARILAGGTDVIVQMETDLIEPELLVDIKKSKRRGRSQARTAEFRIGAAVPGMEIVNHAGLCKAWPGVVDGVKLIGSIQIKGRASIGGNLWSKLVRRVHLTLVATRRNPTSNVGSRSLHQYSSANMIVSTRVTTGSPFALLTSGSSYKSILKKIVWPSASKDPKSCS